MSDDRQHSGTPQSKEVDNPQEGDGVKHVTPGPSSTARRGELASHPQLFAPGSHVGRYRLLAPLASGGMAQVWAAKPEGAGFARTVALKLIRKEYASDEEYARMFIDEATVAAAVHHPNVCETYELGLEDGVLFMAIEWVAGDSLAGLLHRDSGLAPIAEPLAARIVADACAGLHAAHEAVGPDGAELGIVHRDVSPPNILLSLHGQVKVSDFGIAKARYQIHSKTKTGEIKGKFAYIAPEQIGGKGVDRRADIFALGCVLYVATLGLRPFGSGPKAMGKILAGEYKRPSDLVSDYPAELEQILVRSLQRSKADRYQTAEEMRMDLERWLLSLPQPVGTKDLLALVNERLDPQKRKVVETLMRSNQFLPDAMVYQLMRGEVEQTPTATSSVLYSPFSNPRLLAARERPKVDSNRAAPKPMVRFSGVSRATPPEGGARGVSHVPDNDQADGTEDATSTDMQAPSFLPSSNPPRVLPSRAPSGRPTFRPPRLKPIHDVAVQPPPALTAPRSRRRGLWIAGALLGLVAAAWASCQLLPF